MVMFSGSELAQTAVNIERNGIAFYAALAERSRDQKTKRTFGELADMERQHEKTFCAMLDSTGKEAPFEEYSGQHASYLKALADSAVFTDAAKAAETARQVANQAEALRLAMEAEKDSILFYMEMRGVSREKDRVVIERIIDEEKTHLVQLREMLRNTAQGKLF